MSTQRPLFDPSISRRGLVIGGATAVTASAAGCGWFSTDPETESGGEKGLEAPMLAERVEAGELPPVAERLPNDPIVISTAESIGQYGGTWNTAITGASDGPWLYRTINYEPLLKRTRDWQDIELNVASAFEENEDGSEFTITLREGIKWSDGHPLTTADVEFAFYDVALNTDLTTGLPAELQGPDGAAPELEILDDYTFIVKFSGPKPLFRNDMAAGVSGQRFTYYPRHYLEQFHIDYNADAEDEAVDAGYDGWASRFTSLGNLWNFQWENPDLPVLLPWICKKPISDTDYAVFERNPYYYKVDEEGSQLPYIDQVRYNIIADPETMFAHAINGDFHFHSRHFNDNSHRADAVENEANGNYTVLDLESTYSSEMNIAFNLNHADEGLRAVFQDKQFRVAASHAINRQEIIDVVWNRVGEPTQAAPRPESRFYDEEFATQYTEYDPELANQILDDAGYELGSGGVRVAPDGTRLQVVVTIADDSLLGTNWIRAMDMVKDMWAEVGIELHVNGQPRENWQAGVDDNDYDLTVWSGDGGYIDETVAVQWYMAAGPAGGALFARQWSAHYTLQGAQDEDMLEPPSAPIAEQHALYDQFKSEPDPDVRDAIFRQILDIAKEEFYAIGTVRGQGVWAIQHNTLHNVGGPMPENPTYGTPSPARPEQWYIAEA
jgi:peptide/nickel transport system substrate-binding protein